MGTSGKHQRLVTLAAFVVFSVGLSLGKAVVLPVVMALFIAIVAGPAYSALKRRSGRPWVARLIVAAGMLVIVGAVFLVSAAALRMLVTHQDLYEAQYARFHASLGTRLSGFPELSREVAALVPSPVDLAKWLDTSAHSLVGYLWPAWLLVFLVHDALEEADVMPRVANRLYPHAPRLEENWRVSATYVRQLMQVKCLEGLFKAAVFYGLMRVLGVDLAGTWAVLIFLATFLPESIGTPLAIAPPAFMAMLGPGAWAAIILLVTYPVIVRACDRLFERHTDASIKLSAFQGTVATFYWTLVLGPIGAFLALPLTVMARAVIASFDESWPMAVLMFEDKGEQPEKKPRTPTA